MLLTKVPVLNIEIDNVKFSEAIKKFKTSKYIFTPNIDHLYNLSTNKEFFSAYKSADLILCDSKILTILSNFFLSKKLQTIHGSDYFPKLCDYYKYDKDFKVFLLGGSSQKHTNLAIEKINRKNKSEVIISGYSPPFGFEKDINEIKKIIQLVNSSCATVLVVGLGSPKQELFIEKFKKSFANINHFTGLGGVIDLESGLIKRCPQFLRSLCLEWFYRFLNEPNRLFTRYFVNGPLVIIWIVKLKLKSWKNAFKKFVFMIYF